MLLLPIGFGAILANIPSSSAIRVKMVFSPSYTMPEFRRNCFDFNLHRHRRDDRFWSLTATTLYVIFRCRCPVRYLYDRYFSSSARFFFKRKRCQLESLVRPTVPLRFMSLTFLPENCSARSVWPLILICHWYP